MRGLRAWLVLTTFFVFTLPLMPLQLLFLRTGSRYARTFPNWYHRQVCRLVGVRLHIDGGVAREQGVLLISNHVSWLDITVLSAVAPVSFVAKQEVASWPFVSWLAKLQRSVFVDRTRRSEVTDKANEILRRLEAGDHVVLFAEGTSSDGNRVLPFRSALLGAVEMAAKDGGAAELTIQPMAVAYTATQGIPMGRQHRPLAAWYGDLDFMPHIRVLIEKTALDATVAFGEAIPADATLTRKAMTGRLEQETRRMMAETLRGKPLSPGFVTEPDPPAAV